jgi:ankyrin repeat protein
MIQAGETPLHTLLLSPMVLVDSVKVLIDHGADILAVDNSGRTPYDLRPPDLGPVADQVVADLCLLRNLIERTHAENERRQQQLKRPEQDI